MTIGLLSGLSDREMSDRYSRPKCSDDRYMHSMVAPSIQRDPNAPMEAFLVLNPPVAVTLRAWQTASSTFIPPIRYSTRARRNMPK